MHRLGRAERCKKPSTSRKPTTSTDHNFLHTFPLADGGETGNHHHHYHYRCSAACRTKAYYEYRICLKSGHTEAGLTMSREDRSFFPFHSPHVLVLILQHAVCERSPTSSVVRHDGHKCGLDPRSITINLHSPRSRTPMCWCNPGNPIYCL